MIRELKDWGKGMMGNGKAEFEVQLKEEARLKSLIAENLKKLKLV